MAANAVIRRHLPLQLTPPGRGIFWGMDTIESRPVSGQLRRVFDRIDAMREDMIALTQNLVRIPTVNPPGRFYEDCARLIGDRLRGKGFGIEYVNAEGEKSHSDLYPRTNVIARVEGEGAGPGPQSISPHRCGRGRRGLEHRALRRPAEERPHLRPRDLRHEGRHGRLDDRHRGDPGRGHRLPRRLRDLRHGRRGIRRLRRRRLHGQAGLLLQGPRATTSSFPSRCTRTASASAIAACGGPRSRPWAASRTARCPISASARFAR